MIENNWGKWCDNCYDILELIINIETNMPNPRDKILAKHHYELYCKCNDFKPKEVDCYITYGFEKIQNRRTWEIKPQDCECDN